MSGSAFFKCCLRKVTRRFDDMPAKPNNPKDSCSCCCSCGSLPLAIGIVAVIAAVFVAVAVAGFAASGRSAHLPYSYQHLRTITVSASGSVSAEPAMAQVQVSINGTGATAALANANLSSSVAAMNSTILPFLNGNASEIQTTSYQIYQATNCTYPSNLTFSYCITQKLPYYVAYESFTVSVPNLKNASQVITGLSGIPGLQLQGVQAALSDGQQAMMGQEALSAALANATAQADILAGNGIVQVENITVQYSQIYYPRVYNLAGASASVANKSSAVFFGGTATVQRSINVVFSLK